MLSNRISRWIRKFADDTLYAELEAAIGPDFSGNITFEDAVLMEGALSLGTSTARISMPAGSGMGEKIYVEQAALGAGEYLNGLGVYAYIKTTGDISAYARGIRGHLGIESGGLLSEAYGAYCSVTQANGSKIADHAYGLVGHVNLAESHLADLPKGMVVGSLGIYDISGTDPAIAFAAGTAFMAALAGVVSRESKAPHAAVIAVLQGDSALDIAVPAAFKAVAERTTAGKGFNYGLDLFTEAGLCENINTADIRGSKGNIIKNIVIDVIETDALLKATDKGLKTRSASPNLGGIAPVEANCIAAFGALPNDGFVGILVDSSNTTLTYAIYGVASKYNYIALTQL